MTNRLPLGRPRHEALLLVLVGVAALLPVYGVNSQDQSRLCLTRALVHGHLHDDRCLAGAFDKSRYGGHLYSDKAPGLSVLELPAAELLLEGPVQDGPQFNLRLWVVRLLASGLAFLTCAFLVGRVTEGAAPGFGAPSLVAFSLGTLVAPLAAANFSHVPVAALGFGAFVVAARRRPLAAGLLAGTGFLVEYQALLLIVLLGAYVLRDGLESLGRFLCGAVPGLALIAIYDGLAFGAPWHTSYRYIDNVFSSSQASGFFGIGTPHLFSAYMVFAGNGGLLVLSPVLVAAAWGLALLSREHRAEAITCGAVSFAYVLVNCGYFLPYGGISPGPRFLIPALPFLAVGLGPAFAWRPRLTAVLTCLSVVPTMVVTLVWATNNPLHRTVWGRLVRLPTELGASKLVHSLTPTAIHWLGAGRVWGAAPVLLAALAALVVAFRAAPRPASSGTRWSWRSAAVVGASIYAIAAADVLAVAAYPYGARTAGVATYVDLHTSIAASTTVVRAGDPVAFVVTASNPTEVNSTNVVLRIHLGPGMRLLGRPAYERGSGCTGTTTLICYLDFLEGGMSTVVRFGVRVTAVRDQTVTASLTSEKVSSLHRASLTVRVD